MKQKFVYLSDSSFLDSHENKKIKWFMLLFLMWTVPFEVNLKWIKNNDPLLLDSLEIQNTINLNPNGFV